VPTCIDTAQGNLVLSGSEDSIIRLWDTRAQDKMVHQYQGHQRWISQVQFNATNENIFISGSLDGSVKLWDLRNDEMPVANLKTKNTSDEAYKIFACEWNGASQILSGGSSSHINVHSM